MYLIILFPFSINTAGNLRDLTRQALDRRKCAFCPGTLKNHWSAQTLYLQFCMIYTVNPDATTCDNLSAYTEWLLQGGLAVATVRNHMAAIKSLYLWVGNTTISDILASSTWSLTIRGLLNTVRPSYSTKSAFTPEDLLAMMEVAYRYQDLHVLAVALSFGSSLTYG